MEGQVLPGVAWIKMGRLRLAQILKDQRHLSGGEHTLRHPIVRFFQGFGELGVRLDPLCQTVEGCTRADVRGVSLSQFALVIRSDSVFFFHVVICFIGVKIHIISYICNIFMHFVSLLLIPLSVSSETSFRCVVSL